MPEQRRPESADLTDYEVLDASDTLDGDPGDDPLDRGVAAPQRWSAAIRRGSDQQDGESLDELLAEEEPDVADEVQRMHDAWNKAVLLHLTLWTRPYAPAQDW